MRQGGASHVEVPVNVRAERAIELLVGNLLDRLLMLLIGGVVDKDIQSAKFLDRSPDRFRAELRTLDVARNQQCAASFGLDGLQRRPGVRFLDRQIYNGDIGAFAREQNGNRAADA